MTTASSGQLKYQWSRIINDEEEKIEDEECFKHSDSKTLLINDFESKYTGTYRCVISTSNRPIVSVSAELELDLQGKLIAIIMIISWNSCIKMDDFSYTEPPEEFSTEMSNRQFLLYLNANGVHYDVCKKLKSKYNHNKINVITLLITLSLFIENKITAKEFNLDSYKGWLLDLNLTFMEKKALLSLLGIKKFMN